MKNPILRILISALLFSLVSGIVVTITGLLLGWKTSTQFSDGFFWAGAIIISIGLLSVLGGVNQSAGLQYSQSGVELNMDERYKRWMEDTLRNYRVLAFLGTSGLLLFGLAGLAILVGSLF